MGSESNDNSRNWQGGIQIQHKVPSKIRDSNSPAVLEARAFLQSIDFNYEAEGNKLGVLTKAEVRDAIMQVPGAREALARANVGMNVQYSDHPGYTDFVIRSLERFQQRASLEGWTVEKRMREFLVFDDWNSGKISWLLDVIEPSAKAATSVLANSNRL